MFRIRKQFPCFISSDTARIVPLRLSLSPVIFTLILMLTLISVYENLRCEGKSLDSTYKKYERSKVTPIVLVPGDGGSQLEAKLKKPEVVHYFCDRETSEYFDLWLNLELLVPYVLDCWVDNIRLVYDNHTRTTTNSPGVDINVPGFGNTTSVEWLDPSHVSPSSYFTNIVEHLLPWGFSRGVNIRGAPYDFRKAPNELQYYLKNVVKMVEETYYKSENKVLLICHSLGCPVMLYMLNKQSQTWKDKYIQGLVSLGAPWGGAVKALKAFASGENLGVSVINPITVRREQRTSPSLAYLTPSDRFWSNDEVLVMTAEKNYTVRNYYEFFQDINFKDGWEMWKDTHNLTYDLEPPGVEVHCLHGVNVSTIERLNYAKNTFPDSQPTIIYGNGDGTVNHRSLLGCLRWIGNQSQKVYHKAFENVDHMGILRHSAVLEYIKYLVVGV
ncbi:group XV phospholipase A2-like [Limulus polyphemus]|uniref:Group XV phospholipase A2-like n=1 Tax=Limulus polyphemus TaxID=6850 RepID=A0ABM1BG87_LIMPO|nr:group XV phospholipase A2-like [Limulus polyphemus]